MKRRGIIDGALQGLWQVSYVLYHFGNGGIYCFASALFGLLAEPSMSLFCHSSDNSECAMQSATSTYDWPAARAKIDALFPKSRERGQVFSLGSFRLVQTLNQLYGCSDKYVRLYLCCEAGIPIGKLRTCGLAVFVQSRHRLNIVKR